ncbi:hypothetical protein O6H91_01G031800 [Diphasiastrum complanatum]|uniref:Uncharacterized protein n=1 Tax=Diphasiastrum complanatum TaxID=34168 RepID=A0ACC2EPI5_DIPCM|nr:hypothetical protein O6H91_01G031800 [Diphasiastrum complanatum]
MHWVAILQNHSARFRLFYKVMRLNAGLLPKQSSQICFKAAWVSHKLSHIKVSDAEGEKNSSEICVADALSRGWRYCNRKGQARSAQLPFFDWTGPLRPYPISPRCIVPDKIARPDWASDGDGSYKIIHPVPFKI